MTTLLGLARYEIAPTDPAKKAWIERFAATVAEYGNGSRTYCNTCFKVTYRRAPGAACSKCCTHSLIVRGYMRKASGVHERQTLCVACGQRDSVSKWDRQPIEDLLLRDNLNVDGSSRPDPCARCDSEGTEMHHWAPQAIFADADSWPTSPLCPACHREWHSKMREAKGYRAPGGINFKEVS